MFSLWSTVFSAHQTNIPAAFLNFARTCIAAAADLVNGGNYTPSAPVDIQGSGFSGDVGGQIRQRLDETLTVAGHQTIDVSKDEWHAAWNSGSGFTFTLRHSTAPVPRVGTRLRLKTSITGGGAIAVKREDATTVGTQTGSGISVADYIYTSVGWAISAFSDGVTPGV